MTYVREWVSPAVDAFCADATVDCDAPHAHPLLATARGDADVRDGYGRAWRSLCRIRREQLRERRRDPARRSGLRLARRGLPQRPPGDAVPPSLRPGGRGR